MQESPRWEPRTYGPITVEYRPTNDDFHAHLTGDRTIWAAGRNPYEAVGDLVVHHPERFATQAAVAEQAAEVERLSAALLKYGAHTGACGYTGTPDANPKTGYRCVCGLYDLVDEDEFTAALEESRK
jgi:hypothetical protein